MPELPEDTIRRALERLEAGRPQAEGFPPTRETALAALDVLLAERQQRAEQLTAAAHVLDKIAKLAELNAEEVGWQTSVHRLACEGWRQATDALAGQAQPTVPLKAYLARTADLDAAIAERQQDKETIRLLSEWHAEYTLRYPEVQQLAEAAEKLLDLCSQEESSRNPIEAPLKVEWDNAWIALGFALAALRDPSQDREPGGSDPPLASPAPGAAVRDPAPPPASGDPHTLAVEYIDRSIAGQVALGYAPPTAEQRTSAIESTERAIWKMRPAPPQETTPPVVPAATPEKTPE